MTLSLEPWMSALRASGERRLLLMTGLPTDCEQVAYQCWQAGYLWLGDGPDEVKPQRSQHTMSWLGQEYPCVLINGFSGLNPDVLGAVGGAVAAGGLLVLLMPPLDQWDSFLDPDYVRYVALPEWMNRCQPNFLGRFRRLLRESPAVWHWEVNALTLVDQTLPAVALPAETAQRWQLQADQHGCLSTEQYQVVCALMEQAQSDKSYPLVVVADRGRGKSAALGMAASQLSSLGVRIAVTGPSLQTCSTLLHHAGGTERVPFFSPEYLVNHPLPVSLLLVDEAAAIPAHLLRQLQQQYERVVYATTVHGYEGSGQGFMLRMCRWLARFWPQWQSLTLNEPLRWSATDPLEPLLMKTLLLDAEVPELAPSQADVQAELVTAAQLIGDESLLSQLFGLLVLAHYQTTPTDLRLLLDAPSTDIWIWRHDGVVLGVVLLVHEGPIEPSLAEAIWQGRRRPRGQLLPQTLLAHCGYLEAADFHFVRVMRIAVHPLWQQHGVGSALIRNITEYYQDKADFLGCSFSTTYDVLRFWSKQGWKAVRVGLGKDTVTGAHAVVCLQALQEENRSQLLQWQDRFQCQLPVWLGQTLQNLPAEDVIVLMIGASRYQALSKQDQLDLQALTEHFRSPDHCLPAMQNLLSARAGVLHQIPLVMATLLIERCWQGKEWAWLAAKYQLAGQKAVVTQLRLAIKKLLSWPEV